MPTKEQVVHHLLVDFVIKGAIVIAAITLIALGAVFIFRHFDR